MFCGTDKGDVETHCSKDPYSMHSCNSRNHGMSRFENSLDNGVWSFSDRSFSRDPFVSQFISDAKGVISYTAFHCCIEPERFNADISLVRVYNIALLRDQSRCHGVMQLRSEFPRSNQSPRS
jgi:hypothetical protein